MNKIIFGLLIGFCLFSGSNVDNARARELTAENAEAVNQALTQNSAGGSYADDGYFEDDYFEDDYSFEENSSKDTFLVWNKFWHGVNDYALIRIAKPLHQNYSKITTKGIRGGIENFRNNLKTPHRMLNAALQGEFAQMFIDLGRFIINTTTSLGFADVAGREKTLYPYTPDNLRFGYTLAAWGIPEGPYFVIPFYGPSTVREAIGTGIDAFSNVQDYFLEWYIYMPAETYLLFNKIDEIYMPYETLTKNAIDPYIAIKNAYLENLAYKAPKVSKPQKTLSQTAQ